MKMKFSNKTMLDSMSKNYSLKQNCRGNKLLYVTISAISGGIIVGYVMNYFQKKQIKTQRKIIS